MYKNIFMYNFEKQSVSGINLTDVQKEVISEFREGKSIGVKESFMDGYWQEDANGLWSLWDTELIDQLCELGLMRKVAHPPIFKNAFSCSLTELGKNIKL